MRRREEKRIARRYMHRVAPERRCYLGMRWHFCARCWWREVTGENKRATERFVREADRMSVLLKPHAHRVRRPPA